MWRTQDICLNGSLGNKKSSKLENQLSCQNFVVVVVPYSLVWLLTITLILIFNFLWYCLLLCFCSDRPSHTCLVWSTLTFRFLSPCLPFFLNQAPFLTLGFSYDDLSFQTCLYLESDSIFRLFALTCHKYPLLCTTSPQQLKFGTWKLQNLELPQNSRIFIYLLINFIYLFL